MVRPPDHPLDLAPDEKAAIVKRLRRAQGQIGGIARMVEEDRDCAAVVAQLAAE